MSSGNKQLISLLNDALPQTQCEQCGFKGCLPYAEAMAAGEALYNRCPPGGEDTLAKLTQILGQPVIPLDTSRGTHYPQARVAIIREDECIGCTRCIQDCPVDAILGAAKLMHTVIADECTGCELCLPPCPVDCIHMRAIPAAPAAKARLQPPWRFVPERDLSNAHAARDRFEFREQRLERERRERAEQRRRKKAALRQPVKDDKKTVIAAALARYKQRKRQQ